MRIHSESMERAQRPPLLGRRYVVEPVFQYRLVGTLLAVWTANSLFFSAVLYFFYRGHLLRFYELTPRPGAVPLVSVSSVFALSILFVLLFGLLVLFLVAIYVSSQIAGPLHRTKRCLARVAAGDWGFSLQFRQRDFFQDIPPVFNAMMEALRRRTEQDVEELRAIEASAGNASVCRRMARSQRERKEAQLGTSGGGDGRVPEPESTPLVVH